jgi:hypothetical protein
MKLQEIKNPFSSSKEQRVLYHGTRHKFDKFDRPEHGLYVTPIKSWAEQIYAKNGHVIPLYANVTKLKKFEMDSIEADHFYDMDYDKVSQVLKQLSKEGYDAAIFGGESESMVLFNDIKIINAVTGKPL